MPTITDLHEHLYYQKETGRLFWRLPKQGRQRGKPIGKLRPDGRRELRFDELRSLTARVVWALHYDSWPTKEIDHINRDKADDRIENLREATHSQNNHNRSAPTKHRGVYKRGSKWRAMIKVDGRLRHLGYFWSIGEAQKAYVMAADKYFGDFASLD